jgi:hypothetical protein
VANASGRVKKLLLVPAYGDEHRARTNSAMVLGAHFNLPRGRLHVDAVAIPHAKFRSLLRVNLPVQFRPHLLSQAEIVGPGVEMRGWRTSGYQLGIEVMATASRHGRSRG